MPQVIDALVISLGLDPKGFTQGQKKMVQDLKDTEKQAARTASELEARGKQAAQFFSKIRNEVLALGAAFFGARGIEEFTRRMTQADAATGRLASNLGTSVQTLGTWQNAARLTGNTAEDASQSMQNLVSSFEKFALTGEGDFGRVLAILGINATDATGHLKDLDSLMKEIGAGFAGKSGPEAQALGGMIGLTPGMVNTLRRSNDEMDELLGKAGKLAPTPEDVTAAQNLQKAWEGLRLTFDSVGRSVLTEVTPMLTEMLDDLAAFVLANKEEIGENVKAFVVWLKSINWKQVWADVKQFGREVNTVAQAVGGWVTITEVLFALWVGSKFATVIANVLKLATAAGAAADATGAALGVGAVATGPVGVAALATVATLAPSTTNAGEDNFIKAHPEMFPAPPSKEERDELHVEAPGRNWFQAWMHKNFVGSEAGKSPVEKLVQPEEAPSDAVVRETLEQVQRSRTTPPPLPRPHSVRKSSAPEDEESRFSEELLGRSASAAPNVPLPRPSSAYPKTARKVPPISGTDVEQLVNLGWSREQAIGILANVQEESQGDTHAVGDSGTAYGLAQWHPDRQAAFKKWTGKDIRESTREEQIGFIDYELREGGERKAGALLKKTTTAKEAAEVVSRHYERPAAADAAAAQRGALAVALNNQYGGSAAASQTANVTINTVNVNAPNATDVNTASADGISKALKKYSWMPEANQGLT